MLAIRNLLSSLNSLTPSGLLASGRLRPDSGAPVGVDIGGGLPLDADGPYTEGGVEPLLDELLDDPVIHLVMRADHLEPEQVRRLLTSAKPPAAP